MKLLVNREKWMEEILMMIVHFNRRNKCVTSALWSSNNLAVNSNTDTAAPGPYGCQLEYHSSLVSE
jgi:hypothetical protein